jgi:diaminopimelate decarboxylase
MGNANHRLSEQEMSNVFAKALKKSGLITSDDSAILFYDLKFVEDRVNSLKQIFPQNTLHAIAAKANPLTNILSRIKAMDVGLEVASLPELYLAEHAGFSPGNIVFDSPCKTVSEIQYALKAGVYLNADSFDELDRINEILKTQETYSKIGLRINPQVGTGNIKSTSVAGSISKFGVPVNENRDQIIRYFVEHDWLKGIHVHIGSQGCPVPLLISGIRKVLDLALEINMHLEKQSKTLISVFDIGGGLPVSYKLEDISVTMEEYKTMLYQTCPELFDGQFRIVTEFGRHIHANAGWVAAKVEYVKRESDYTLVVIHVGADLFLRRCYNPADWYHHISVTNELGKLKTGTDKNKYIVAGPLCFAGDVLATHIDLPVVNAGDYVLIHDAGAYNLSMWSRYNSRQMPKVVGYFAEYDTFEILKERESKADLIGFWS